MELISKDRQNLTKALLSHGCATGHIESVKFAVNKAIFYGEKHLIFEKNEGSGLSPIEIAAEEGYTEIVEYLFDQDSTRDHSCALISAVQYGHLETVRLLLNKHADVYMSISEREDQFYFVIHMINNNIKKSEYSKIAALLIENHFPEGGIKTFVLNGRTEILTNPVDCPYRDMEYYCTYYPTNEYSTDDEDIDCSIEDGFPDSCPLRDYFDILSRKYNCKAGHGSILDVADNI